jgi:Uma2 family endonuclease
MERVRVGMSLTEFLEQRAMQEFELINGEKRIKMPGVSGHSELIRLLFRLLDRLSEAQRMGETYFEATFILPDTYDSQWVRGSRIPDIMFYAADRIKLYKVQNRDWNEKPFALVPDFIIEVISPTDKFSDVMEKIELYLQDGVHLVWAVDMKRKKLLVFSAEGDTGQPFEGEAVVDAGDIVPGFAVKVADLFPLTATPN